MYCVDASRATVPAGGIRGTALWSTMPREFDTRGTLRAVMRLAYHRWRSANAELRAAQQEAAPGDDWCHDSSSPCGGCSRCVREQLAYYSSVALHASDYRVARSMLKRKGRG